MRKGSVRGDTLKSPKSLGPEMRSGGDGSWADGPKMEQGWKNTAKWQK